MKCDEARPNCTSCQEAGLTCGGYEKTVFFGSGDANSDGIVRFRRPLLTESERASMSETLTSSVPPSLALWHIEQIEEGAEAASRTEDFECYHGCFGAFRVAQTQEPVASGFTIDDVEQGIHLNDNVVFSEDSLVTSDDMALTPRTRQLFQSILEDPMSMHDLFSSVVDPWDFTNDSTRIEEIFDIDFPMSSMEQSSQLPAQAHDFYFSQALAHTTATHLSQSESPDSITVNPTIESNLPQDAVHLVKHYSTTVLKLLTPFRHSKTPWHVLFVPHAKNCLAALTLGEAMDHASLCAFYAILAVSAFSLNGVSGSRTWLDTGRNHKQKAREHARQMLHTAYDIPKTAKYKSILMALLTMVQVAMITGDAEQTDCYFMEAEKFIRVKGLNRKKSRKVRLLHHCYAFERMFHESTFVASINSNHRRHVRKAIESSGAVVHSHDSLTFRLGNWSNLEQDMMKIKGKEEGENDLHLQLPGTWSATLYPEIFGVPEVYIFLLSLTIRLGEQKDAAEKQNSADTLGLKEFLSRAKAVERSINNLKRSQHITIDAIMEQPDSPVDIMLDAMQNALAIYFYRRIYDVDASILQSKVEAVRDCLLNIEPMGSDMVYGAARMIWPAFIAGCEAEDPGIRSTITKWFDKLATCSGSRLFADTKANIERIWTQKSQAVGSNISWVDLMRSNGANASVS